MWVRDLVWHEGEEAALSHYLSRGYRLLARNWRCRLGEIDLVLERDSLIVFCEVKARRGTRLGGPYEAVTPAKQRKLRALGEVFLGRLGRQPRAVRFDVASVSGTRSASVHVFEDAF